MVAHMAEKKRVVRDSEDVSLSNGDYVDGEVRERGKRAGTK